MMDENVNALAPFEDDTAPLAIREPDQTIREATSMANAVSSIVRQQKLYTTIGTNDHVHVEGWTAMLAMMGVVPQEVPEYTRARDDGSYVATVELVRMNDERVVGRGTAECGRKEPDWMGRPDFQRRSMAVTRATGKAARLAFSWIMVLAGYNPTPAEEMIDIKTNERKAPSSSTPVTANPSDVPEVPFGKNKGVPITELSGRSLKWYTDKAQSNVNDPEFKKEWLPKERAWLGALLAEGLQREQDQSPDDGASV